jgi:hypothetical protein
MTEITELRPRFARLGDSDIGDLRGELAHEHELRVRAHAAMDRMATMVAEEHRRRLAAEAEADELHERFVAAEDDAEELGRLVEEARSETVRARQAAEDALRELESMRVGRRRRVLLRAQSIMGR